ncbi:MAG TPA: 3-isopropylmalate dehydrogenase, partial [Planctomycetes bacterium]|nr:3-isopropylmalate dehydrogenase [Planctomycetota bacterium]
MRLCVLGGDGIGPEVTAAALEVLQASGLEFTPEAAQIGFGAYEQTGQSFP